LLAAFSSLILGLFIAARSTAGDGAGCVASGADPFWAILLLAWSALVAAVGAFVARRDASGARVFPAPASGIRVPGRRVRPGHGAAHRAAACE